MMSENAKAFFYGLGFGPMGFLVDLLYCGFGSEALFGFLGMLCNGAILFVAAMIGLHWNS